MPAQYQRAYDQWVRDVNASDGMLGRPLRLLLYDDLGTGEKCVENFQKLIKVDKVEASCTVFSSSPWCTSSKRR